jgi:hypothetical protein
MIDVIDDGSEQVTAEITSGDYTTSLLVTDENRDGIIYDGYLKYVDLPFEALEIKPPSGNEYRRILREYEAKKGNA